MADETQNAPVAGAQDQNATEEKATLADATKVAPYIYYYSDPDETNPLLHHLPIPSFIDLSDFIKQGKLWKVYNIEAPDKSMEDPVVDLKTNTWVENGKNAQTQVIAEATQKIAELDKKSDELDQKNDQFDQVVKQMQQVQAQSSQQNVALMKSFTEQTQNTNKMLATLQQTLAMVVKQQNTTAPAQPKVDASADQPQATTDTKQENGGN
ncbi:hypothetical protein HCN73_00530 [Lactobacillus crispatus]|uniref:hypothetical protein n=1 Tax=Lactobacillus crispatus TaxID=47770 RepID=UPI0015EC6D4B|nr:hypothetical protein [Lactobacillus crispatus]MBA2914873.1 hypothetical protein [Lactobacillus crispatus]